LYGPSNKFVSVNLICTSFGEVLGDFVATKHACLVCKCRFKKYLEFKKPTKLIETKGIIFLKIKSRWILIFTLPKKVMVEYKILLVN
jgi:hypothetical protein